MVKKIMKVMQFPVIVEKDENNFYVAECPLFEGCYTQGRTIEEALKNIKEVIELCIEEKTKTIEQREISLHLVPVRV